MGLTRGIDAAQVERAAAAIYGHQADAGYWICEHEAVKDWYRRQARAALEAAFTEDGDRQ